MVLHIVHRFIHSGYVNRMLREYSRFSNLYQQSAYIESAVCGRVVGVAFSFAAV